MEIITNKNFCIITPISHKMDIRQSARLFEAIKENIGVQIGLDMDNVSDCTIDFIEMVMSFTNLNLYNIQSDIFALFCAMGIDKRANLYVSKEDFLSNKNKLLNRKFSIV